MRGEISLSLLENFTEDLLEEAAIEILEELGYENKFGPDIAFDGNMPERKDYKEVILEDRVKEPLFRINKDIPKEVLKVVMKQVELMCSNEAVIYNETIDMPMVAEEKENYIY